MSDMTAERSQQTCRGENICAKLLEELFDSLNRNSEPWQDNCQNKVKHGTKQLAKQANLMQMMVSLATMRIKRRQSPLDHVPHLSDTGTTLLAKSLSH